MLKKVLSAALIGTMSFLTCFAQTASAPLANSKTQTKLTRADFYKIEPLKFDFDKEAVKTQTRKNNLSSGAKTALWVALFAAGVATVVILATRNKEESTNSPCGVGVSQVGVPCPPGCVCIQ
jgi:anaerobic C4-dicarboxylate transporter